MRPLVAVAAADAAMLGSSLLSFPASAATGHGPPSVVGTWPYEIIWPTQTFNGTITFLSNGTTTTTLGPGTGTWTQKGRTLNFVYTTTIPRTCTATSAGKWERKLSVWAGTVSSCADDQYSWVIKG